MRIHLHVHVNVLTCVRVHVSGHLGERDTLAK